MTLELYWSDQAKQDLLRLYQFLEPVNPVAASEALLSIHESAEMLLEFPGIGTLVDAYAPRHVQCWLAGNYELHYERVGRRIYILSVWHQREDRP